MKLLIFIGSPGSGNPNSPTQGDSNDVPELNIPEGDLPKLEKGFNSLKPKVTEDIVPKLKKNSPKTFGDVLSDVSPELGADLKKIPEFDVPVDVDGAMPELESELKKGGGSMPIELFIRFWIRRVRGKNSKQLLRFYYILIRITRRNRRFSPLFKGIMPQDKLNQISTCKFYFHRTLLTH